MLYGVHKRMVPDFVCSMALRRILLEVRRRGVSAEQIQEWASNSWFPHLRWEMEFEYVKTFLPKSEKWADTQILVRLPDEEDTPLGSPHIDTLPPWAEGYKYRRIYGVELTNSPSGNTIVYPLISHFGGIRMTLERGDVLDMDPRLKHSGSPNISDSIRVALFYRALERSDG